MATYHFSGHKPPRKKKHGLLESEEQFRLLADCASEYSIYIVDEIGLVRNWNSGSIRMYRYKSGDVIGKNYALFFGEDDIAAEVPSEQISRAREIGRVEQEGWRIRGDGSRFLAHNTLIALQDDGGGPNGFALVTRDLTARIGLEDRFRRVVESAPSAIVMVNASGHIVMVNEQSERMFGYSRAEMLGNSVDLLVPASFRGHHPDLRESFFVEPVSRPMGAGRDLYALRKDGSEFPVEIGLNPIATDEGVMVLSAIVDISKRKRLEERFKKVVESAPNAMVMINHAGLIEMVNAQAENVFGYLRAEMLGKPIEILVPERFRSAHPALRGAFFKDPRSRPMGAGRELYGLRKDGSEFPVEIGLNPIETDEGPMVLSAIVDISDRKQKEDNLAASMREKDIMLGEIHHRVKNNLQIVISLLDLQAGRINDEKISAMLRDSQNRVRSMALIHQILYQSKDFSEVNFAVVLERLIPALIASYSLSPGRVDLEIKSEKICLPLSKAIPCGLIVNELVANALKHGFPGGAAGRICVTLGSNALEGSVNLQVSDNGIGFPMSLIGESPTTLGLELVTLLVDQLGGTMEVDQVGLVRFSIIFPLEY